MDFNLDENLALLVAESVQNGNAFLPLEEDSE
jgi:hypothetical protein